MKDKLEKDEAGSTPEDVAKLYSWAGLGETKYRLFAASREQARVQARERKGLVEAEIARKKIEEEEMRRRVVDEVASASLSAESPPPAVAMGKEAPEEVGSQRRAEDPIESSYDDSSGGLTGDRASSQSAGAYGEGAGEVEVAWREELPQAKPDAGRTWQELSIAQSPSVVEPRPPVRRRVSEVRPRSHEVELRPAEEPKRPSAVPFGQPLKSYPREGEGIRPIRRREEPRWAALQDVFTPVEADRGVRGPSFNAPTLALFSLTGGVGKTSIVASLGRIFAAQGERVLLLDTSSYGVLPFYFGARSLRPGVVRSFSQSATLPPIQILSIDPEMGDEDDPGGSWLPETLFRDTKGVQRVLIDVATGSAAMTRRILELSPTVLVPLQPNMTSVVNLQAVEAFLRKHGGDGNSVGKVYYILSHFDASLPLHRDVQAVLRQQLGDRLLPFVLRRSPAVSEALAEGTTVVDYAPGAVIVEDLLGLSKWVSGMGQAAGTGAPALRWRER